MSNKIAHSFLKLFYRPSEAIEELRRALSFPVTVTIYLVTTVLGISMMSMDQLSSEKMAKVTEMFPFMAYPRVVALMYGLVADCLLAGLIHLSARAIGGRASFKTFLASFLLLSGIFEVPKGLLSHFPMGHWLVWIGQVILIGIAISVTYRFTAGKTIASYVLAWVGMSVASVVAMVGLMLSGISMDKLLQGPPLTRTHTPARYEGTLKGLDHKEIPLASLKGKVIVLNKWATWCGPCRFEMPSLQRLHEQVKNQGIVVLAVSDEETDRVAKFIRSKGYTFPVYTSKDLPAMYESPTIPATFILSASGELAATHNGASKWDDPSVAVFLKSLQK
jgi:thiol-disulfide isomerase/thioredoxin